MKTSGGETFRKCLSNKPESLNSIYLMQQLLKTKLLIQNCWHIEEL
jgi:hypothetical protein